jgi:hypothetical protein
MRPYWFPVLNGPVAPQLAHSQSVLQCDAKGAKPFGLPAEKTHCRLPEWVPLAALARLKGFHFVFP